MHAAGVAGWVSAKSGCGAGQGVIQRDGSCTRRMATSSSSKPGTTALRRHPRPDCRRDAARARKVQQLINQAEQAYRSGVDNYRAGHLDAARTNFDAAVDLILTSGIDVKTDPQLSDEFEHLLDAVNSLEMAALKQGNGFSPALEAAPLDAANEVTFPANAALTAKVAAELKTTQSDFPLVINDYVAGFISYFSNSPGGHAHLLRSLERAGKYKDMIANDLREQGVPQDLIYLAVAESGFQPQALECTVRRRGACGSSCRRARTAWRAMAGSMSASIRRNRRRRTRSI